MATDAGVTEAKARVRRAVDGSAPGEPMLMLTQNGADGPESDVMSEGKKDLVLVRLRPDLSCCGADVASRFGLVPTRREALEAEEAESLGEESEAV